MPITGSGGVLAAARIAAEQVVKAKWAALGRALTPQEQAQMLLEMKTADSEAIVTHLVANTVVTTTGGAGTIA